MAVGEALMIALSGFLVVFIMLCVLWAIIDVINRITTTAEKAEKAAAPAASAAVKEEAPAEKKEEIFAGELALIDVDEKTAACIMAIIADETKIPLNQLIFKSIRAVA